MTREEEDKHGPKSGAGADVEDPLGILDRCEEVRPVEKQRVEVVGNVQPFVHAIVVGAPVLAFGRKGATVDLAIVENALRQRGS